MEVTRRKEIEQQEGIIFSSFSHPLLLLLTLFQQKYSNQLYFYFLPDGKESSTFPAGTRFGS